MANIIEKFKALSKKTKSIIAIALSAVIVASSVTVALVSCEKEENSGYDTETYPVVFAISALDQNFNPFFVTSGSDTEVIGMTQVGLISSNEKGEPVAGNDQPTVALDFSVKSNGKEYTDYEFLIKNGVKFSDGKPLTIEDVLFNLYVYLDPVYTGSATIYSTDIQGLNAYRAQDPTIADDYAGNIDEGFYTDAQERIEAIIEYAAGESDDKPNGYEKDVARIGELFKKELESDWNANYGTLEDYETEYSFTHDWQTFYFNSGLIFLKDMEQNDDGTYSYPRDNNGKYLTTINNEDGSIDEDNIHVSDMAEAISEEKVSAYASQNNCTQEEAKEALIKAFAIESVYNTYVGETIDEVGEGIAEVLYYWNTGSVILEEFKAEARTEHFAGASGVSSIKGITTYKTNKFIGQSETEQTLAEEHDVLKIRINGVDPKAIWNFAFSVAPMHYYSGVFSGDNGDGKNYVDEYNGTTNFGVKANDYNFFQEVLRGTAKSGLPVGAGVYMATNATDSGEVTRNNFFNNGVVYYKRNPYFYTLGIDGYNVTKAQLEGATNDDSKPIHNAFIKYFNYQVVAEDQILNQLASGAIHYGEPSSSRKNYDDLKKYTNNLDYRDYDAGGYGYVGINPKFVPEMQVRRAIMKAMDVSLMIDEYYAGGLASQIYRPMSITSWAYPGKVTEHQNVKYETDDAEIRRLVEAAGYVYDSSDGYYKKDGKKITLKFTIAGGTTDHPATVMFEAARRRLNAIGFDITVGTDVNALKNLATGNLAVWAAAWSSPLDPDMYQVYHKNSTATSILNWNYKEILFTDKFPDEKRIVNELSVLIDDARETTVQAERADCYAKALDKVMELAIELPTYQRKELAVYNKNLIDANSLNENPTWMAGVVNEIWKLNFN